jgi:hypothetical protein
MEYKEATLGFGRRRLLIFELFLGLHRKRQGEEGGIGLFMAAILLSTQLATRLSILKEINTT